MRIPHAVPLVFTLLFAACQNDVDTAATAEKSSGMPDAADLAANDQLRDAWVAAAERDDAAAVAALYAEDAILIGSDGTTHIGRAAIQAALNESFPLVSGLSVTQMSSDGDADVRYSTGEYAQTATTADGRTMPVSGTYLVVTHRQMDGSWKIVRHSSVMTE